MNAEDNARRRLVDELNHALRRLHDSLDLNQITALHGYLPGYTAAARWDPIEFSVGPALPCCDDRRPGWQAPHAARSGHRAQLVATWPGDDGRRAFIGVNFERDGDEWRIVQGSGIGMEDDPRRAVAVALAALGGALEAEPPAPDPSDPPAAAQPPVDPWDWQALAAAGRTLEAIAIIDELSFRGRPIADLHWHRGLLNEKLADEVPQDYPEPRAARYAEALNELQRCQSLGLAPAGAAALAAALLRVGAKLDRTRHLLGPESPLAAFPPPPRPAPRPQDRLHFADMKPGERYRVKQTFTDFDGQVLEAGTLLTFRSYTLFHYDGGYTVYFDEAVIRLAEVDYATAPILKHLREFLERADPGPDGP